MTDYALAVSDAEVARYMFMAERAATVESALWDRAGIAEGAEVADIGCGPAAVSVVMARRVGRTGRIVGVEREDTALAAAREVVARAGVDNVELRRGAATDTGLPAASVDVAVLRHVLAHNGDSEQQIVDHLAALVRPGGTVYLVDIDGTAMRVLDIDPDLEDLQPAYVEFHRRRGNDLQVGLRLGRLLTSAGLDLVVHEGSYDIIPAPPGLRPPPWAARDAMVAEGVVAEDDVARWAAAFERSDSAELRPTLFVARFVAIGRRPG